MILNQVKEFINMFLTEELEELIYESKGIYDEEFKSKLFEIFTNKIAEDDSDIQKIAEKMRATWSLVCNRHAELDTEWLEEYFYKNFDGIAKPSKSLPLVVKFKKLYPDSVIPTKAHESDAGMDMYVHSLRIDLIHGLIHYGLGVASEIPKCHVGLCFPRSSIYKLELSLSNSVGVIDAGYRGEIGAKFRLGFFGWIKAFAYKYLRIDTESIYRVGERCCQMIILPYPQVKVIEAEELFDSDRGTSGYGGSKR